ncbi:TPA: asparagine synthase [Candidatus Bathyarchaeota archaeon]|nr:asparagine synthase [Candidatus Bathyarchaeota archaeon]
MYEATLKMHVNEVLKVFDEVIRDCIADSLMLSGGLDTSIIACLVNQYFKPKTLTVGFTGGNPLDICYAKLVAKHFNLQNEVKFFSLEEADEAAARVVEIIRSFDPMEIRNDITIFIGMRHLKEAGVKSVITGDGGDELFAGYPFLFKLKPREVDRWVRDVVERWFFAAKPIGESLGLKVLQPFTDNRIINLALKIPAEFKIAERNGITYGKYVLRKAFEGLLPAEVVWRAKHPIELGSGSTELSKMFKVTSEEFAEMSKIIHLNSQEQAYYFKIYLKTVGVIPEPKEGEKACPRCGGGLPVNRNHCKICGAYPV